jgi:hypothetical protein
MTQVRGEIEKVLGYGFFLKTALRSYKIHIFDCISEGLSDEHIGKEAIGSIGDAEPPKNCDGWIKPGTLKISN